MNSLVIGEPTLAIASTQTDNQACFSDSFTTIRATGLGTHPAGTTVSLLGVDGHGVIQKTSGSTGDIPSSTLSAKGELLTNDGSVIVALPVGSDNTVLTADSSAADGISWSSTLPNQVATNTTDITNISSSINTIQGQLPKEILFTTTLSNPSPVTWTVPSGVSSVMIEAMGGGAAGASATDAGAKNSQSQELWNGGGGGGSGQLGYITIPVKTGQTFTILVGGVATPSSPAGSDSLVRVNGVNVITCNGGATGSGMTGGSGASLNTSCFSSYSCGGGGGMAIEGGGSSGSGGAGSQSFFNGSSSSPWGTGNSGDGGLNTGGIGGLSTGSGSGGCGGGPLGGTPSSPNGSLGCGGAGGQGTGTGPFNGGNGGPGYVKLRLY